MKTLFRLLLATECGIFGVGCSRHGPAVDIPVTSADPRVQVRLTEGKTAAMEFASAEVTFLSGDLAHRTKRIDDQESIRELFSFFPGAGLHRKSAEAAPWESTLRIKFVRTDGTAVELMSNYEVSDDTHRHAMYFWSEGDGDWLIEDSKSFDQFVRKLHKVVQQIKDSNKNNR